MSDRRELYEHHLPNGNTRLAYIKETDPTISSVTVFREVQPGDIEIVNEEDLPELTPDEHRAMDEATDEFKEWLEGNKELKQRHAKLVAACRHYGFPDGTAAGDDIAELLEAE